MVDNVLLVAVLTALVALILTADVLTLRVLVKRPGSWLVRVVGHYWWSIGVVYVLGCIPLPVGPWDLVRIAAGAAALGVVLGAASVHDRVICERCVAAWPLDAPARAEKRQGWLRFWHRSMAALIVVLVVVLGLWRYVSIPTMAQAAIFGTVLLLRDRAHAIHTPLQPWCPTCGDGGGGDDREVIEPQPDPAMGRS